MLPLPVQHPAPESKSSLLHSSVKGRTSSTLTSSKKTKGETKRKLVSSSFTYQSLTKSLQMEKPLTNHQICNLIADRLAELRSTLSSRLYNSDRDAQRESLHHPTASKPLDGVKISRGNSGLTPTPKDEGYPRLTEHPGIKKEGGGSKVFTPSGGATENLENRNRIPHAHSVLAQKKRGDSNLKAEHVTGLERTSTEEHNAGETALADDAGSAVTNQTRQMCSKACKMMEEVTENRHTPPAGRTPGEMLPVAVLRDPQYDDISDEDLPGMTIMKDEGEHEIHSEPDDDDDGWDVIPVSILNLKLEPAEHSDLKGDGENGNKVQKPVPASAFAQMEVFDTPVEQEQTVKLGQLSFVMPSLCSPHKEKSHSSHRTRESCSEAEDSNETEDSCDYSSGPEGNYLTVSRQLLKNLPASALPKTSVFSDSKAENEKEDNERRKLLGGQSRRRKEAYVIDLDSGDESDKKCTKRKRRKKRCSSPCSENRGTTSAPKKTRQHFPETVPENFHKARRSQEDSRHQEIYIPSQRTDQHGMSRQIKLDDENIIILSDSDE
ncbi:uncharacterized protein LOC121634685 [Melanotaenia boesemani]|uniref:uncharacterized protein LOC121634685 n=1 Tax=Melanotaenia boesemani TaxID=1250792 RepID=UPI001C04BF36|nr:uncharacterized protein LOC121634685 [Melanotaenia boesemani]XP_041833487.1 uncharacterized protein LOC121634685 [Melanotaenia boesemani]